MVNCCRIMSISSRDCINHNLLFLFTRPRGQMFKNILTFGILFLSVTFLSNSAISAEQKILQEIIFNSPEKAVDQITFKLNGPHIPKIFAIQGERPRVVFDFVDTKPARLLKNTINTNGKFVQRIRMGIHYKPVAKTRVVFDLFQKKKIDFDQHFDKQNNTLTITVFSAEKKIEKPPVIKDDKKSSPVISEKKKSKETPSTTKKQTLQPKKTPLTPDQNTKKAESVKETVKDKATPSPAKAPKKDTPLKEKKDTKQQPSQKVVKPVVPIKTKAESSVSATKKATKEKPLTQKINSDQQKQVAQKTSGKKAAAPAPSTAIPVQKAKQAHVGPKVVPVLQSVSFDKKSNQGEMVLFRLNTFQAPIVFGVEEGEPRVVCDFKDTDGGKNLQAKMDVQGKYIHSIRINKVKEPKKVRVVLDLAANKNYDLQQVFFKKENLFILIINTQEKAATKVPLQIPPQ